MSLQVSWKVLLERTLPFLEAHDPQSPLFLYVNIVDTHFPYFHDQLDPILDVAPITRRDIRSDRAEQLRQAYANTAANVDRAVERLVEAWWSTLGAGNSAIVITADHGQSFYENGFLGHGQGLGEIQTRVPLIVWGIGGEWPEPVAISDVRELLVGNLGEGRDSPGQRPRARFVPDPQRRILQYAARLARPQVNGLRGLDGVAEFRFEGSEFSLPKSGRTTDRGGEARELEELIWSWEAAQAGLVSRAQPTVGDR